MNKIKIVLGSVVAGVVVIAGVVIYKKIKENPIVSFWDKLKGGLK